MACLLFNLNIENNKLGCALGDPRWGYRADTLSSSSPIRESYFVTLL